MAAAKVRWLPGAFALLLVTSTALGQERGHPLEPPDRSSPRATLKTFLDSSDALYTFLAREYRPSPTREEFTRLLFLTQTPLGCLDLRDVPPTARSKVGRAAAVALYETLGRIDLPAWDEIPGADQTDTSGGTKLMRWVVPHTEITIVRVEGGASGGEFLFSADTVGRADAFYERVRGLPYARPVPLEGISELLIEGGGWPIRPSWIQAMPAWLRAPLVANSAWKWIALALLLGVLSVLLRLAYRLSLRGSSESPFLQALAQFTLPLVLLLATPARRVRCARSDQHVRGGRQCDRACRDGGHLPRRRMALLARGCRRRRSDHYLSQDPNRERGRLPHPHQHAVAGGRRRRGPAGHWGRSARGAGVRDRRGPGRGRSGHRAGRAVDDRESDRQPEPVRRQADSRRRLLPVRRCHRHGGSHRDSLNAACEASTAPSRRFPTGRFPRCQS